MSRKLKLISKKEALIKLAKGRNVGPEKWSELRFLYMDSFGNIRLYPEYSLFDWNTICADDIDDISFVDRGNFEKIETAEKDKASKERLLKAKEYLLKAKESLSNTYSPSVHEIEEYDEKYIYYNGKNSEIESLWLEVEDLYVEVINDAYNW